MPPEHSPALRSAGSCSVLPALRKAQVSGRRLGGFPSVGRGREADSSRCDRDGSRGYTMTDGPRAGPIEFLKRRAAEQIAAAKRFHEAAGAALDLAMDAALDDLPRL